MANLVSHQPGPGADRDHPETAEIERVWREVWLPAFEVAPTLAKVKRELFEYAELLIAEDKDGHG